MKKILPLLIAFFFIAGCSLLGVHPKIHNPHRAGKYPKKTAARVLLGNQDSKFRTCYDVTAYSLDIDFSNDLLKDHQISGHVGMVGVAITDFDTLQIDLASQFKIQSIALNNPPVLIEGNEVLVPDAAHFFRKGNAVFVIMPHHIKKGEKFSLSTSYSGIPKEAKRPPWSGGFVYKEDDLKKPWLGVACQTEGASSWWPCKDVVNDEPDSVDMLYSGPANYMIIGNGELKNDFKGLYSERELFHWHVSNPINIYNITFYIGNYKLLHDTYYSEITHDTLQLNHYVLEQHYDKAVQHFKQVKKYLAFYEKTFGPYPWYRDGFKLVEST
jgi:aminopeptidase N